MEYYCAGCVESIEADGNQITAVVEGTEDYDVLIELDRGKVLGMEERGKDREAFDISCRAFLALDEVEKDDSDGGISIVPDRWRSVWQTILERADDSLRRDIFDWLMAHCGGEIIDYLMQIHGAELLKRHPDQVLGMYARAINRAALNTADRPTYRQWVQTLAHMREMPGREEIVAEIVAARRAQYKRRSAMMDELKALWIIA